MLQTNRNRISPPVTTTVDMSHGDGLQVTRRYAGQRDARQVVEALMRCHDS